MRLFLLIGLLLLAAAHTGRAASPAVGGPAVSGDPEAQTVGRLANPQLVETSGLAASRRSALLWAVNDGGNPARLFAVGPDGADHGSLQVLGASNRDWEDLAAFRWKGEAHLMIADVGNNRGRRREFTLYVLREPAAGSTAARVAWRLRFRYEDAPRDCEAVAVDAGAGRVLLLSKRTLPAMVYSLPLQPPGNDSILVARRLGAVNPVVVMPTAMDISADGASAVVLTYSRAYWFLRRPSESWRQALERTPRVLDFPRLIQQEAICFASDAKTVYVSGERRTASLVRIRLKPGGAGKP